MARLALTKPIAAFLDLVALSEGTKHNPNTHDDGYDIIVTASTAPTPSPITAPTRSPLAGHPS